MNINQKNSFVKYIINKFSLPAEKREKYKGFVMQSWAITWPMLMILLFDFCMNMTDIMIARLIGKEVQAAIGMANQTYSMATVVISAVTIGTIAILSRVYGSSNRDKDLPSAIYTTVICAVICAIVITVLAIFFAPFFLSQIDIASEVKTEAIKFVRIYCIGMFFHLMMIHFNGILRACKCVRVSMKVMVCASILNIILNIIFVFYTPLGSIGIPLSTAICWIIAFFVTSPFILKLMKKRDKSIIRKFSRDLALKILKVSWPVGIVSLSWQLSGLFIFTMVGMLPENSVETMAALTAGFRIESAIFMPAFAFNMANAVLVGNLLGENKPDDAYTVGLVTVITGVSLIVCITIIVISAATPIAHLLASKNEFGVADPIVLQEIIRYLHIVMISEPFVAANLMFTGALSGAGDTKPLMRYNLFSLWALRIPVAYIFGIKLGFGAIAIWWAMNITFFSQSFLSCRRYISKKWIN